MSIRINAWKKDRLILRRQFASSHEDVCHAGVCVCVHMCGRLARVLQSECETQQQIDLTVRHHRTRHDVTKLKRAPSWGVGIANANQTMAFCGISCFLGQGGWRCYTFFVLPANPVK